MLMWVGEEAVRPELFWVESKAESLTLLADRFSFFSLMLFSEDLIKLLLLKFYSEFYN